MNWLRVEALPLTFQLGLLLGKAGKSRGTLHSEGERREPQGRLPIGFEPHQPPQPHTLSPAFALGFLLGGIGLQCAHIHW